MLNDKYDYGLFVMRTTVMVSIWRKEPSFPVDLGSGSSLVCGSDLPSRACEIFVYEKSSDTRLKVIACYTA